MSYLENDKGLLENLDQRIRGLMSDSKDPEYTVYLQKLLERVRQQKYHADLIAVELDRSYQMYLKRMQINETPEPQINAEEMVKVEMHTDAEICVEEKAQTNVDKSMGAEEKTQTNIERCMDESEQLLHAEETKYFNLVEQVPVVQEVSKQQMAANNTSQLQYQSQPPMPVRTTIQKKSSAEFTIGAAVLSVVGGGFILAALVTLGMTFMEGMVKGLCLYGVSLLFLLVSELVLYRKWPKLGATFSAIGIGGLYLSTIVNYLGLHNFSLWVTLGIIVGITLFVVLLSRRRDSNLYRIIGIIAGYLCFFAVESNISETEFYAVTGMILFWNTLCIVIPVRKTGTGMRITHIVLNTIFAILFMLRVREICDFGEFPILIFIVSSIVILQALFVSQVCALKKKNIEKISAGFLTVYYISSFFYLIMVNTLVYDLLDFRFNAWYCYSSVIAISIISLITILVLSIKKCTGQGHIYLVLSLMLLLIMGCSYQEWDYIGTLLILVLITKSVCCWKKSTAFRIADVYLTVELCLSIASFEGVYVYALLAGVAFSILMICYWQTYYEIILTITLVAYTATNLPFVLQLPAVVGILLVCILAFNNVKRWQGKYILLFNGLALGGQIICFLRLCSPMYQNEYITYLCMLVFGIATIGLTFQEKYQMNFSGKYLVFAIFLTYMAFIVRTNVPVVNSILLMVIALVCVGTGFVTDKKSIRIYGLVMSLVVCGKLVLYDFFKAATLQKTILFFTVGVIALVIASIYIILEKKNSNSR